MTASLSPSRALAGQMIFDNSCPADLDQDGSVGFQDLLQVLGDVAASKYNPQTNNAFSAIIKVLSEWGDCEG